MKKKLVVSMMIGVFVLVIASLAFLFSVLSRTSFSRYGISTIATTHKKEFRVFQDRRLKPLFIKGVNMGAAKPMTFPGELAITKEEYLRWFIQISQMSANTIRVYTTMTPAFYEALYEFNQSSSTPLYIMQGVWLNEEHIKDTHDAFANDGFLIESFVQDAIDLVNIFHGNASIDPSPGKASGVYTKNVSHYIIGWILGVEWDPEFVYKTILNNPEKTSFESNVLKTNNATPFEVFLAQVGSRVLEYEIDHYQMTRPISFVNWLTTDALTHSHEPDWKEDFMSVDVENIQLKPRAIGGMFASYHIYPYYPEFMNHQPEYTSYIDQRGNVNPYKAYLLDLYHSHTIPVLVAEFGIPSSRGKAHDAIHSGLNQGNVTEQEQGIMLVQMLEDIVDSGYMGALVFAWQDEWFKRTWNTMDYDLDWRRPFWSNIETNEQYFGLLAFDPGLHKMIIHLDQDDSEWEDIATIFESSKVSLKVTHDARFLYMKLDTTQINHDNSSIVIAISNGVVPGNTFWDNQSVTFGNDTNFMIHIESNSKASFYVDRYYDSFEYLYGEVLQMIPGYSTRIQPRSGQFQISRHVLSSQLIIPVTGEIIPFSTYESGSLRFGVSDPTSPLYDSLSDILFGDGFVEIRIPWLLLNVMDPSTKQIMSEFVGTSFVPTTIEGFSFGVGVQQGSQPLHISFGSVYSWNSWDEVIYHERLKPAYYLLKAAFEAITYGGEHD
ncbi:MAG: family 2 glycosyl transferase [bacterium]|nr:family 2 glycosyl transferase [bacterium]